MTEQGNRWLLTRPDPMNGVLSRELTALGDAAWVHPLLCIEPLAEAASRLIEEPFPWKHVIFTSQPAVEHSSALLARLTGNHGLLPTCYAVGDATQSKLAEYGIKARSGNEPGSESLLRAMLPLPPRQSVLLVTGEGGRTLIEDTLRAGNHLVTRCEVYRRRSLVDSGLTGLVEAHGINRVLITSVQALEALVQSLELTVYEGLTVVAVSERIADVASNFGFPKVVVSQGMNSEAVRLALESGN